MLVSSQICSNNSNKSDILKVLCYPYLVTPLSDFLSAEKEHLKQPCGVFVGSKVIVADMGSKALEEATTVEFIAHGVHVFPGFRDVRIFIEPRFQSLIAVCALNVSSKVFVELGAGASGWFGG